MSASLCFFYLLWVDIFSCMNITSLPTTFPSLASLTTLPSLSPTSSDITSSQTISPSVSPTNPDIGCNYMNLGGVAVPTDYCMQIDHEHTILHIKWNCNDSYNGINIEVYVTPDCSDTPVFIDDFSSETFGFSCNPKYQYKKCDEVSINAYPTSSCDGKVYSEIRLITEKCVPAFNNTFKQIVCTESSITVTTYEIANNTYDTIDIYDYCDDKYLIFSQDLEEGSVSLEGESAGCIAVEGCGDYASEHKVIDIGCNYVNFNGFGISMDYCMVVKTEKISYSYNVYCNETYNGIMFAYYLSNECNGTPIKEIDVSQDFQFVCNKDYKDISCNSMELRGYVGKSCSGKQYYDLNFITNVCLYDDIDIYYKVNCGSSGAILSTYETIDGQCTDENLVNSKSLLDTFEMWDIVLGCSNIERCDDIVITTPTPVDTTTINTISNGNTSIPKTNIKKIMNKHKSLVRIVIICVGSVSGLCALFAVLFLSHKLCKQKREIKIMDAQTHSGRPVKNPYGHINSIGDVQESKIDAKIQKTDDTLLNA